MNEIIAYTAFIILMWGGVFLINRWHKKTMTAINKTSLRTRAMIDAIFTQDDWQELIKLYDQVDFEDCYKAEGNGVDCLTLYHPRIQALFSSKAIKADNVVNLR